MKKKWITILLTTAITLSLVGCGTNQAPADIGQAGTPSPTETVSDEKEEATSAEVQTLTFLIDGAAEGTDGYLIKENIKGFEDKYNVKVNFVETPYAELHQKLMTVSASGGDDFDAVFVETDFVAQLAKAGVLEPLDSYMENSETLSWDDFIDSTIERNTVQGKHYAIPQVADVQTTVYNKEVLSALGIENPPSTIPEFIEYCEKAKAEGYIPLALRYDSGAVPCQLMGLFLFTDGGSFVKQEGDNWIANLDNETGKNWINNVREIFGNIDGDTLVTMDSTAMYEALNSGRAGCTIAGSWIYDVVEQETSQKLIAAPFPKGSANEVALMSGWNIGIFANSKNKELAFKLLEYKADAENAGTMTAGLSGRKDAEAHFTDKQKEYYPQFQNLMQYGVAMAPTGFDLRSDVTTAFLPIFQQVTFDNSMPLEDAAKLSNDTIQKVIDDNQ